MNRCVYTILTGGYEPLNPQPAARGSSLPFICFTDTPDAVPDGWEIRPLQPVFPGDDIRNQRSYKLQPHLLLPEFDQSLYIDNSVQLLQPPERLFEAADLASGLCLPLHSYRTCLADEFQAILDDGLDDPSRVLEQQHHYQLADPQLLTGPVFWTALLLRDHHAPQVQAAMQIWLAHIYRYSRRDQLSVTMAFHLAALKPGVLAIDNYKSEFHSWPHLAGRKTERRLWRDESPLTELLRAENRALQQEIETLRLYNLELREALDTLQPYSIELREALDRSQLDHQTLQQAADDLRIRHDALLHSTSWRITAPIRALKTKTIPPKKN